MTMITPSYLGETIEYSSLHACRSTLEDPTLIDAAQYKSGNVFIAKHGYKRSEPYEAEQSETPEVLRAALIALQASQGLLPRDVARRLNVQPVLLGKLLGLQIPDLGGASPSTVVNFNARLNWSRAKWH